MSSSEGGGKPGLKRLCFCFRRLEHFCIPYVLCSSGFFPVFLSGFALGSAFRGGRLAFPRHRVFSHTWVLPGLLLRTRRPQKQPFVHNLCDLCGRGGSWLGSWVRACRGGPKRRATHFNVRLGGVGGLFLLTSDAQSSEQVFKEGRRQLEKPWSSHSKPCAVRFRGLSTGACTCSYRTWPRTRSTPRSF